MTIFSIKLLFLFPLIAFKIKFIIHPRLMNVVILVYFLRDGFDEHEFIVPFTFYFSVYFFFLICLFFNVQ
jgi:hypothetical protein